MCDVLSAGIGRQTYSRSEKPEQPRTHLRTSGGQAHKHRADLLLHQGVNGVNDERLYTRPASYSAHFDLNRMVQQPFGTWQQ